MRRYYALPVFLFFTLFLSPVLSETIAGKVVAVADGDTITVLQEKKQIKVRLHGIDAPESGQDFGQVANDFTADLCFEAVVTVVVTDTDRYGRKVGLVILRDGRVLNHELVAAGLAHWYEEYARGDEALRCLQDEAKAARRGLWSRPDVILPADFRKGKRNGTAEPYNPPPPGGSSSGDAAGPDSGADAGGMVYVTETGTKFHREGCRTLRASKRAVSRSAAERGYEACGICRP